MNAILAVLFWARSTPRYSSMSALGSAAAPRSWRITAPCAA
jgi:hypothetical protein